MGGAINWNCNCRNKTTEDEILFPSNVNNNPPSGNIIPSINPNSNTIQAKQSRREQREEDSQQLNNERNTIAKDELVIINPIVNHSQLIRSIDNYHMNIISDRIIISSRNHLKEDKALEIDDIKSEENEDREKDSKTKRDNAYHINSNSNTNRNRNINTKGNNKETNRFNQEDNNVLNQDQERQFTNQSFQIQSPLNDDERPGVDISPSGQSSNIDYNREKSNAFMWKSFTEMQNSNKYFSQCEEEINVSKKLDEEIEPKDINADNDKGISSVIQGSRDFNYEIEGENYQNEDYNKGKEEQIKDESEIFQIKKEGNVIIVDEYGNHNDINNKLNDIEMQIMVEFDRNKSLEGLVHYKNNNDNMIDINSNVNKQYSNNNDDNVGFFDNYPNDNKNADEEYKGNIEVEYQKKRDEDTIRNKDTEKIESVNKNKIKNIIEDKEKERGSNNERISKSKNINENQDENSSIHQANNKEEENVFPESQLPYELKNEEEKGTNNGIQNNPLLLQDNTKSIEARYDIRDILKKTATISSHNELLTQNMLPNILTNRDTRKSSINNIAPTKTDISNNNSELTPQKSFKPLTTDQHEQKSNANVNANQDQVSVKSYENIDQNDKNSDSKSSFTLEKRSITYRSPKIKQMDNVSIFSSKYSPICHHSILKLEEYSTHCKKANNDDTSNNALIIKTAEEDNKSLFSNIIQPGLSSNSIFDKKPYITTTDNNSIDKVTETQDRFNLKIIEEMKKSKNKDKNDEDNKPIKIYKQHDIAILPQNEGLIDYNNNDFIKKKNIESYFLQQSSFTLNKTSQKNNINKGKNDTESQNCFQNINDNFLSNNNKNQTAFSIEKAVQGIDFLCQSTSMIDYSHLNTKRYESYNTSTVHEEQFSLLQVPHQNLISQSVLQGGFNSKEQYSISNISVSFPIQKRKNKPTASLNKTHQILPNYKTKKYKGSPNISILKPKGGELFDEIVFHSHLKKIQIENVLSFNPHTAKLVNRFCVLTSKEFRCFISKEQFITLQKPFYVLTFDQIEKVELVKLPKTKYYNAFSLTIDIECKETHQALEDILIFQSEKKAVTEKWVSTIQFFLHNNI